MSTTSRRSFLKTIGVAAAAPNLTAAEAPASAAQSPAPRPARFAPRGSLKKLSDNLFLLEDTCNVYLVKDGSRGLLIDFGSGKILDHLADAGVSRVDWLLHTHHHRDQCQGDRRAVERGIKIAVPAHERHLFADAENFWRNRRVFHLYYVRNDFNTITENIPVAELLRDYSVFKWNGREISVLPTPGHTPGSISLLLTVDAKRVAFTGDLMHSAGKLTTLHDTQITYGGFEGLDLGSYSLASLQKEKPALLCPSHGEPMADPDSAIQQTIDRLVELYRFERGNDPSLFSRGFALSPHLVAHHRTTSSFYAILSASGKALFIDYGSASGLHFSSFLDATPPRDRMRFVEHNIADLQSRFGMKSIEVAMPSHMHDDHMNGFPHLIRRYGTKIWCYENMQEIFENPRGHNLGCTLGEAFKVARTFRHGERFKWEEYDFEITHSPGHTEYQMALFVTIDGARVAFTGDAVFANSPSQDLQGVLRHNVIFRNHVESDSHLKSIRNLIEREPTLIAPGHGEPYLVTRAQLLATEEKMQKQEALFKGIVADPDTNFGLDPSWCSIYPNQLLVAPGDRSSADIRVRNYRSAPMKVEVALVAPAEWKVTPDVLKLEIAPGTLGRQSFSIQIPQDWRPKRPRFAIAADVLCDGKYLGQITEAVVELAI